MTNDEILKEALGTIKPNYLLGGYNIDSLDYIYLISKLEDNSHKKVSKEQFTQFKTVGDLQDFFGC